MAKTIKLWDAVRLTTTSGSQLMESPAEIWECFGWDIENDANAKECADIIMRELFCFGHIDLSAMNHGKTLLLSVVTGNEVTA